MSILNESRSVERPQFFDGQRLFASDMQGLEALNRELRWLHNSSLHQPGIGSGFAVAGKRGDREVTVGPGYALDVFGREIVHTQSQTLQVPPISGSKGKPVAYDLVVSYPPDEFLEESEARTGMCDTRGVVRRMEEPIFCWVRMRETENGQLIAEDSRIGGEIERGERLVLARAKIFNCVLFEDISVAQRRNARPEKGPQLACGSLIPDPWQPLWLIDEEDLEVVLAAFFEGLLPDALPLEEDFFLVLPDRFVRAFSFSRGRTNESMFGPVILPVGMQSPVDTSEGCFRGQPSYFTRLGGSRIIDLDLVSLAEALGIINMKELSSNPDLEPIVEAFEALKPIRIYIEGLPNVVDPRLASFQFQAPVMVQLLDIPNTAPLDDINTEALQAHVEAQLAKHPVVKSIQSCVNLAGDAREECLHSAAREAIAWIGKFFIQSFIPDNWEIVWMGIEE